MLRHCGHPCPRYRTVPGSRSNRSASSGEHRSARFAGWGERLWKRPVAYGALALAALVALAIPATQLKIAMPSIKVIPISDSSRVGYQQVQAAMGPGATGPLQIVTPAAGFAGGRV